MPPKVATAKAAPPKPDLTPEEQAERLMLIEECKALVVQKITQQAAHQSLNEEKDRLNYLWVLSKQELEDKRALARAKDRELSEHLAEHAVELKVHKQRIKHMMFEHQSEVTQARTDGKVSLKLAHDAHVDSERELKADRQDLQAILRDMELSHEDYLRVLKAEQDRNITELRLEFERETRELSAVYEDRMSKLREELNNARGEEIRAVEKRKTKHIATLVAAHEKAFSDIKLYYNEITHSNLDLIKSLKEEAADLKTKEASDEKIMYSIAQENKKMSEPMRKTLEEVRRLREERQRYRTDIQALQEIKAAILVVQDKLGNAKWEHEILEQRYLRLVAERDELYTKFTTALHEVKRKSGFRGLLLETRLAAAAEEVERESVTLAEVLLAANIEQSALGDIQKSLEHVVGEKDEAVAALQQQLSSVSATHDATLDEYASIMREHGIPTEELGFRAARSAELLGDLRNMLVEQ